MAIDLVERGLIPGLAEEAIEEMLGSPDVIFIGWDYWLADQEVQMPFGGLPRTRLVVYFGVGEADLVQYEQHPDSAGTHDLEKGRLPEPKRET